MDLVALRRRTEWPILGIFPGASCEHEAEVFNAASGNITGIYLKPGFWKRRMQQLLQTTPSLEVKQCLEDELEQACENSSTTSPPASKDKRKKKKKKSKSSKCGPEQKPEESKGHDKTKQLRKCSTFPSSDPWPLSSGGRKTLEYEDACSGSVFRISTVSTMSSSCPSSFCLRSAFRGSQEGVGLGPRPKLHVKWASDVHDPPSSIASHTVVSRKSSKKKKEHKQQKEKSKSKGTKSQKAKNASRDFEKQLKLEEHLEEHLEDHLEDHLEQHLEEKQQPVENGQELSQGGKENWLASSSTFLASMELAMQHMLHATKSIDESDFPGALVEYKAASRVFRRAKSDAESDEDREAAVKQAALASIAMATLYSAIGNVSKSQKFHELALEACEVQPEVGAARCSTTTKCVPTSAFVR